MSIRKLVLDEWLHNAITCRFENIITLIFVQIFSMKPISEFNLSGQLRNAIDDLGFENLTPIQSETYPVVLSGKDLVGIAQTGTGKTFAYLLPLLRELKFSKQVNPRILILVPTRELVIQVVEQAKLLTTYMSVRTVGVYGGVNIKTHGQEVGQGADIIVATPGRLYDLVLSRALQLKSIAKLVIDEVDVMLDLGFRFQLQNIFELLPQRRQNIMFSATMTVEVDALLDDYFNSPAKISIAVSGTPLDNIDQQCYSVDNFNTKINLLVHLLHNKAEYEKVLVFISNKKSADVIFDLLEEEFGSSVAIIHSNKTQNYRIRSIENFEAGTTRILVATDVIARGLDIAGITHVINFDVPQYPENYMHRIGRTGRAERQGTSLLFYTAKEGARKEAIESLMSMSIPICDFPEDVEISQALIDDERPQKKEKYGNHKLSTTAESGASFHEKKEKNKATNQGGSYKREMEFKYKKPQRKGGRSGKKR